jgi:ELWxxDGT repeat protein
VFYTSGNALKASNGTVAGTTTIASVGTRAVFSVGNRVLFVGQTASAGRELFISDGTVAGTALLKELVTGTSGINDNDFNTKIRLGAGGTRLFLSFQNPAVSNASQLWISDATAVGTVEISGNQITDPGRLFVMPTTGSAAMLGYERQAGGNGEPFFTNGVVGSTVALGNFVSDVGDSYPSALATINQRLVFNATIDGANASRTLPVGASSPVQSFVSVNEMYGSFLGKLWLQNSLDLAFSDGTVAGTSTATGVNPNVSDPGCMIARNGVIYFPAGGVGGVSNGEIFKSDGTVAGTMAVTNFAATTNAGLDSFCFSGEFRIMAALGDKLLFAASDGTRGIELFALNASDTASLVLDINPGSSESRLGGMTTLTGRGALPDVVVFTANDGTFGTELWVTGGTAQNTQRISDINPGAGGSDPRGFLHVGSKVFFTAFAPASGRELYVSDGTAAGTMRVVDLFAGFGTGISRELLGVARGKVYFTGLSSTIPSCILFESDGSATGTQCAYDSAAIALRGLGSSFAVTQSGAVVFSASRSTPTNEGEEIRALFNRQLLTLSGANIAAGSAGSAPTNFLADGDSVYFTADDGLTGSELWRLDLPNFDRILANGFE